MGAKFQQHSSGSFTAEPSAPINGHRPVTTSLKYTLCLQRKQSRTSYKTSHCFVGVCWTVDLRKNVTYEANQLHVAETWHTRRVRTALSLMERSPVTYQHATTPPHHIIHPTSPQTSQGRPVWIGKTTAHCQGIHSEWVELGLNL